MTEGPDWAETLELIKRPAGGGRTKNGRLGLEEIAESQKFQQERALADTAVALGAVDTGDDFSGADWLAENAADPIAGYPGVRSDLDLVFGEVQQVKFGLITLADLASTRRRVPHWVSPNPFEYVSFARALLGREDGTKAVYTIPAGTLALGVVSIEEATTNNQVRFIAGGDTPPTHVYVGLWKVDQVTGDLTPVYNFGDVRSDIDTGSETYEVALEMSADMLLDAGEIMMVGILPVGGSFTVGAIPRQQSVPNPVIYPQASTELLSGLMTLPGTAIADSALDHTSSHRILVSVGQALPETYAPVAITVTFNNYASNNNWSSPSVTSFGTGTWAITDGRLRVRGGEFLGPTGYNRTFIPLQKCATDNMFSEIQIGSAWTSDNSSQTLRAGVLFGVDGTAGVMMRVHQLGTGDATVTINTVAGDINSVGTEQAASTDVFQALVGDWFRIEAIYDPLVSYSTFTCYRNGDPVAVWADTGNVAPHGVAWRRAACGSSLRTHSFASFRPADINEWRAGDIA